MKHLLFMCVANSARSQLAEAIARSRAPEGVTVYSAGSRPNRIHPLAVRVLEEIGLDASAQWSKGVDETPMEAIDTVITLCAEEVCPVFPRPVRKLHWPLPDPGATAATEDERLEAFRQVREEIQRRLAAFWEEFNR